MADEANGESSNDAGGASAEVGSDETLVESEPVGDSGAKKGSSGVASDVAPSSAGASCMTPTSVGTQSPRHGAGSGATMVEEDEHGKCFLIEMIIFCLSTV